MASLGSLRTGLMVRYGRRMSACRANTTNLLAPRRTFYMYSPEPFHPIVDKEPTWVEAEEAVQVVTSGMRVFIHGCAATPLKLVDALVEYGQRSRLRNVELIHMLTEGPAIYTNPEFEGMFRSNSLFIGKNCREAVNEGRADFVPIFLSEIPHLFRRKILKLDVALIQVSPPDPHGFCTLGPSVDLTRAAIQNANYIIAQVNPNMPRTFGDGVIHMSHCDYMVSWSEALGEITPREYTEEENKISSLIAGNLVRDGATLQTGIGAIPELVMQKLADHRDLGVHSELFSDGIVDLVESGVITNNKKVIRPGKIVGGFAFGTKRLYDFIDNNQIIDMCDIAFVNNTAVISQNPKVTAINSCLEVDLTGQVASDSIGNQLYSGVGGQIDFIRGAAQGLDGLGKPILALQSTNKAGESNIVPFLHKGGGVVTTRAHVHYIVTEYGIAFLFGKNLRQRAYELIKIAHPDHREDLERAALDRLKIMPSP